MKKLDVSHDGALTFHVALVLAAVALATIGLAVAASPNRPDSPPQTQAGGSKPSPVASITLPDQAVTADRGDFSLPVTVSKIVPGTNGNLQAFQGDFIYDSSVISFQDNNSVTPGPVMTNNGGQWSLMANPNLTHTDATMKTLRVTAFCLNNVGLATEGASSNVLFMLNVKRVGKAGTSTAMTWGSQPEKHFRFFDVEGFERIPANAPAGKIRVPTSNSRK
jgi:hypothetical protein